MMLALLEIVERDGRVRRSVPVSTWPLTVGRALDNDVVLDDPHVAAHHVRIEPGADGVPELRVLPSVNALVLGRRRLEPGSTLRLSPQAGAAGEVPPWTIGHTRLRLRLPGETLEPERPLARVHAHLVTLVFVAVFWAWSLVDRWIQVDPGGKATEWLPALLGPPLGLLAWTGAWMLASKLFQHRLDFWPHLGVAARGAVAMEVARLLLPALAGIGGWAWPSRIAAGVGLAIATWVVLAHARLVWPHRPRTLATTALAAYAAGAAVALAVNRQTHDRWFDELYTATLPPPALQWAPQQSPERFVADAQALLAPLQAAVRRAEQERLEVGEGDEEE